MYAVFARCYIEFRRLTLSILLVELFDEFFLLGAFGERLNVSVKLRQCGVSRVGHVSFCRFLPINEGEDGVRHGI